MPIQTRSQRYAVAALACVEQVVAQPGLREEYKSSADGFPVMVMQAGLAQALGFLLAKSACRLDNGYGRYLHDLAAVLRAGGATTADSGEALHQTAIHAALADYRRLTREALAAAAWLKRMAQAHIRKPDAEDRS